ncbi:hypothetical protein [Neomoorella thermoacetica]|uniref:ribonuclease toxin HepT-like protein n=1 Tax=Neomoorella thermoacetica TaxID=1525 RepID=UPI0008FBA468|nr:hypothetical protein [Moorella thermoacetica]APC09521.1 hypothetical protein MTJW_23760 [Moorella thermoacetica]
MIPEKYLLLEARIRKEVANLERLERELARYNLFPRIQADSLGGFSLTDEASLRIIGSILHDYYTAIEKIFRIIARDIDCSVPTGEQRHKELLDQMTLEVPGLRPALLDNETARKLDELRAFRHVFRNIYGFSLDGDKIRQLLEGLPELASDCKKDLHLFTLRMRRILGLDSSSKV